MHRPAQRSRAGPVILNVRQFMDTLTFITKISEALAWPIASVMLVVLLRKEIRTLAPLIRRLKAGPVEAEFERGAEDFRMKLPEQPKVKEALESASSISIASAQSLGASPRGEVLDAWLQLEAAANEAIARNITKIHGPGAMTTRPSARGLSQVLKANGLLHEGQIELFNELLKLRNEVVHTLEFSPTQEALARYIDTANYLRWWLNEGVSNA